MAIGNLFKWICNVPIGASLCLIGIIGNIVSILVWRRFVKHSSSATTSAAIYFINLALMDIGYLFFFILTQTLPTADESLKSTYSYAAFYSWCGYPMLQAFMIASIWVTVGVTINRYILIRFPIRGKELCNKNRTYLGISLIILLALSVNVPHFFNYHPMQQEDGGYKLKVSTYGDSDSARRFHITVHCALMTLIPWVFIATLNFLIIRHLKMNTRKFSAVRNRTNTENQDNQLTNILLCITFSFIVLLGFQCITQCLHKQKYRKSDHDFWEYVEKFYVLGKLAIVINCSFNWFFYCFAGRHFRNEAKRLITNAKRRSSVYFTDSSTRVSSIASVIKRNQMIHRKSEIRDSTASTATIYLKNNEDFNPVIDII